MASALFRIFTHKQQDPPPRKKGIVTGVQDLSEVEAMIQRYLELAQSALQEDETALRNQEQIPA